VFKRPSVSMDMFLHLGWGAYVFTAPGSKVCSLGFVGSVGWVWLGEDTLY